MASRNPTARVEPEPVTVTAACETGRHWLCKGTVLSLTSGNGSACECPGGCHGIVRDLPAAWAEQVAAYPPCDMDLVADEELAAEAVADLALERSLEDAHFAEGWS